VTTYKHIPTGCAAEDFPCSSMAAVTVEGNLETGYEQSVWDHAAVGGTEWKKTIQDADAWEGFVPADYTGEGGLVCAWPLRAVREGGWRHLTVDFEYQVDHDSTLRVYLVSAAAWLTFDATGADPLPGVTSYAEASLTAASWTTVSLEVTPQDCTVYGGDGTIAGLAIPVAFVQLLVRSATDGAFIELRSPRVRESLS